jgi:hypothetical protein
LRYNKTVADITKQITGDNIIWARSTWAGSQRYPLHWGGDAEASDMGMEAQLRGGLSIGLSGFSFGVMMLVDLPPKHQKIYIVVGHLLAYLLHIHVAMVNLPKSLGLIVRNS